MRSMTTQPPEVLRLPLDQLTEDHKNPRHGDITTIASSLRAHGQFRPVLVNKGTHTGRPYEILAGNHTIKAMRTLHAEDLTAWSHADVWLIDVDEENATRIVLADNRTSDLGSYTNDALLDLLDDLDGDYEGTGYTEDYVRALLGENTPDGLYPDDEHEPGGEETTLLEGKKDTQSLMTNPNFVALNLTHCSPASQLTFRSFRKYECSPLTRA